MEIQELINNIDGCISWVKSHKEQDYEQKYLQLVEQRRKLKQIAEAEKNNPGIAAFGMSQVGKSYLVGCLLKGNEKAFTIKAGDKTYNFSTEINPPSQVGGGIESTGVVSRFSSLKRNKEIVYNENLPIVVKTFSLTDIIIILSDSYYKDIDNYNASLKDDEIIRKGDELKEQFSHSETISRPLICADDVLFIKEYFSEHLTNAKRFVDHKFFDKVATIIEQVPVDNYLSVFSFIWNSDGKGKGFDSLFNKLYNILSQCNFTNYLYLPIESALHEGVQAKTILSVQCLKKLFDDEVEVSDVFIYEDGQYTKKATLSKSDVSAICCEAIFKIEDSFLNSSQTYNIEHISKESQDKLTKGEIRMSMLKDNDLLDFPGAKSRTALDIEKVNTDTAEHTENLMYCFLRGKVAYLFNQYSDKSIINILLFCHHNKASDVNQLPTLLKDWVERYVGKTPKERAEKLKITEVSPLFFISTMFNLELNIMDEDEKAKVTRDNTNIKWTNRFDTVANSPMVISRGSVDWVNNWTKQGENFRNSYVLRDFKFSCPKHGYSYSGWAETGAEQKMLISEQHYKWMLETFSENQFCKQFFKNPQLSFEVAASMNNDGSLYILENLSTAAKNIGNARDNDFDEIKKSAAKNVYNIMFPYYTPDDEAGVLAENILKSAKIRRLLDPLCSLKPEFFGLLLSNLQISETDSFNYVHDMAKHLGTLVNNAAATAKNFTQILAACNNFEGCETEDDKWQRLIQVYRFADKKEAEEWLKSNNIDYKDLFNIVVPQHTPSAVITGEMLKFWEKKLKSTDLSTPDGSTELGYLVPCLISAAKFVNIDQYIEKQISGLVDGMAASIPEESVADIISSVINNFVMDFGYSHYSDQQKQTVRRINDTQKLHCFNAIEQPRQEYDGDDDEVTSNLFGDILKDGSPTTKSFDYFYATWKEYMTIAFVANLKVPDYDKKANDELKKYLEKLN